MRSSQWVPDQGTKRRNDFVRLPSFSPTDQVEHTVDAAISGVGVKALELVAVPVLPCHLTHELSADQRAEAILGVNVQARRIGATALMGCGLTAFQDVRELGRRRCRNGSCCLSRCLQWGRAKPGVKEDKAH